MTKSIVGATALPGLGDYAGWAKRFVETCAASQQGFSQGIELLHNYAAAVGQQCAQEAAKWGADPEPILGLSAAAMGAATHWVNKAERMFGSCLTSGDPRVEDFLVRMFRDIRASQIDASAKVASHQASRAFERNDRQQISRWRSAEAALEAMLEEARLDASVERSRWMETVSGFTRQVAEWARERNWNVEVRSLEREEELLGSYEVPLVTIQTERGVVMIEPVARIVAGSDGRIDLYAHPTRFGVTLLRSHGNGHWRIRTDSRVFLPQEWNKETFAELVRDLTAAV